MNKENTLNFVIYDYSHYWKNICSSLVSTGYYRITPTLSFTKDVISSSFSGKYYLEEEAFEVLNVSCRVFILPYDDSFSTKDIQQLKEKLSQFSEQNYIVIVLNIKKSQWLLSA